MQDTNTLGQAARILLLEDDPGIAKSVVYVLERVGLQVTHCLLVRDAHAQLQTQRFDALVLDIGLPDGSGLDLCKTVRADPRWAAPPVLMLSAHSEEIDRVLGLELGADDYVSKPFSPRELVARVRALLRRGALQGNTPAAPALTVLTPGLVLDTQGQRLLANGQLVSLTRREYGLLLELARRPGHICSRDYLLDRVWGQDSSSTDRTVDTHIKTLRAKLLPLCAGRDPIETHRGMGYALELVRK